MMFERTTVGKAGSCLEERDGQKEEKKTCFLSWKSRRQADSAIQCL